MNQKPSKPTSTEAQGEAKQPEPLPSDPLTIKSEAPEADSGNGKNRRHRKHKSGLAVRVEAGCAVLLVIITGFYTHYASQQAGAAIKAAEAAKSAADTSARQLELTERPWIYIVSNSMEHFGFIPNASGGWRVNIQPKLTIKNIGNIPAVNVQLIPDFFLVRWEQDTASNTPPGVEAQQRQRLLCAHPETSAGAISEPATIIPGATKDYNFARTLEPAQEGEILRGMITPMLMGCVTYQFSSSNTTHQTGFIYFVYGRYEGVGSNLIYGKRILASDVYLADVGDLAITN